MYVNKSHSARGFLIFGLTIDSVLRVADSSICITNQLKQLQVQMYASSVMKELCSRITKIALFWISKYKSTTTTTTSLKTFYVCYGNINRVCILLTDILVLYQFHSINLRNCNKRYICLLISYILMTYWKTHLWRNNNMSQKLTLPWQQIYHIVQ